MGPESIAFSLFLYSGKVSYEFWGILVSHEGILPNMTNMGTFFPVTKSIKNTEGSC